MTLQFETTMTAQSQSQTDPMSDPILPLLRVGVPETGGKIFKAARERQYAMLFSANAFAASYPKHHERAGEFRKFNLPDPVKFGKVDAVLDSAGFVAAFKYGDYRWSVSEYYDLVAAFPWTWHSSMDLCCEPEVAGDKGIRLLRMAATAYRLWECRREALDRGLPAPVPILQGWHPEEYLQCAEWLSLPEWPDLIGIGSVCRRHLTGSDGLFAVIDALDRELPEHVKFHLFGVKSTALEHLAGHRRIASVDSMAWDYAARAGRRTGRTQEYRIGHMVDWVDRQNEALQAPSAGVQTMLFDPREFTQSGDFEKLALNALTLQYADLVRHGDMEYLSAVSHCQYEATILCAMIKNGAAGPGNTSELEDMFPGLLSYLEDCSE